MGSYIPQWVSVLDGIEPLRAITFVINRQHRAYTGKISLETTINSIATASGELGSCSDYLMQTVDGLMKAEIKDEQLLSLSKQVLARQKETVRTEHLNLDSQYC